MSIFTQPICLSCWRELEAALARNREGMEGCAFFTQYWCEEMKNDPLALLQTGLAVMLDKPFIMVVPPGQHLPENLRRLARVTVEADISKAGDPERPAHEIRDALEALG